MSKNTFVVKLIGTINVLVLGLVFLLPQTATAMSNQAIAQLTNQERAAAGLPTLAWNGSLSQSAWLKVQDMCAKDYWSHDSPDGSAPWTFMDQAGYKYYTAGENLANGYASDAAVVAGWMASPGHRENILSSKYADVGVASMQCVLLGQNVTVVVAHYASMQPVRQAQSQPKPVAASPTPVSRPQPKQPDVPQVLAGKPAEDPKPVVTQPKVANKHTSIFVLMLDMSRGCDSAGGVPDWLLQSCSVA